ncbi:hypothetical protein, partial [Streptomyces sp. NPDC014622]|uniref:hypothetical protein n=1 Tax=Streptomyces sp. NPDC014622 TaxID=3364874 RepID=UPI0036F67C56
MTVQNGRMLLIKLNQPKGEGPPAATGIEIRTGNGTEEESGKVGTVEREKRESVGPGRRTRFDRESDTKESDRVGNA